MKFIGQQRIVQELQYIIPELREGRNLNLLFRAPSGCGKTRLAFLVASLVDPDNTDLVIPDDAGNISLYFPFRIVILDEVHTLVNPEVLYPYLDSGANTFILCSNEFGQLKEPLVNRCLDFVFDTYTDLEIGAIILQDFLSVGIELPDEIITEIVKNCNKTPRIARKLVERLIIIFKHSAIPSSPEEMRNILTNVLHLEDGLNPLHRRYLDYLEKVKRASIDSIIFATRMDKQTILREVEPVLVNKNLIQITSRGRILL